MADIKTHLRELSVAAAIGIIKGKSNDNSNIEALYKPASFFEVAQEVIDNDISPASNIATISSFSADLKQIIDNGIKLAKAITTNSYFIIPDKPTIKWLGNDTQKEDPTDIVVDKYNFSLKEESFILENMGLYKLLNCYTGSNYPSGRHIFKDYALKEYEEWFECAWKEMIVFLSSRGGIWNYRNISEGKAGSISLRGDKVHFVYSGGNTPITATLPKACSLSAFELGTDTKIREQLFSRFINERLQNNKPYNLAKKNCAIAASNSLAKELCDNLKYSPGLARFLRIHDEEYYYAKTTATGVAIFKVPSIKDYADEISIDSIVGSVPDKQANILTTIRNKRTGKTLVLRNECRFSHGQFNGTPEAKMYYERGGSLETIYQKIQ